MATSASATCASDVQLAPFSSFLYWHMEYHTEHHTFPGIPCYNLKRFHALTREHWDPPQTLIEAWREINRHSKRLLCIPDTEIPTALIPAPPPHYPADSA